MSLGTPPAPTGSIAIYTAISGRYDRLRAQPASATRGVDLVAFLDRPRRLRGWQARALHQGFADPNRNAKIHKILSHVYFPDKLYTLWIDGSVTIEFSFPVHQLISRYLGDCDLALFQHYRRTCLYQEAQHCIHTRADDPNIIRRQAQAYTRQGYPANAGLSECSVLLRRHTEAIKAFNEAWWNEIQRGSRRDQVSFAFVARRCGLTWRHFPGSLMEANALFHRGHHCGEFRRLARRRIARAVAANWWGLMGRGYPLARPVLSLLGRLAPEAERAGGLAPAPVEDGLERVAPPAAPRAPVPDLGLALADPPGSPSGSRDRNPLRVAFGPERDYPSWDWVGGDTSRELAKYYRVTTFASWSAPPECDVLVLVKEPPPPQFLQAARARGSRIVYCPIDVYASQGQLAEDADRLRACDMVLVHSERLLPLIRRYCPRTHFVEHHARYALPEVASYKETGFVLWVGGLQYLPYLVSWLQAHPIHHPVRILTDVSNHRARYRARVLAVELGLGTSLSRLVASIPDCQVYAWSERRQLDMMRECKAALDVKFTRRFNQYSKPPAKAQKYVASGIPFAINPDSYSAEYFRRRGFEPASPAETAHWFSRVYWEATMAFGQKLREWTSLETVGLSYRHLIDSL
jgi:hypothetical protein